MVEGQIIIEQLVSDWLEKYRLKFEQSDNLTDYFALVVSVSVFRDLIMTQFKKELERDISDEYSADDMCEAIIDHAAKMAKEIDHRVMLKTAN